MSMRFGLGQIVLHFVVIGLLTACVSQPEGVYQGGILMRPGPIALTDNYSFQFLDKWRLRFSWISGPVDIRFCHFSRESGDRGEDRFVEVSDKLFVEWMARHPDPKQDKQKRFTPATSERIYGTNTRTGEFQGHYSSFCHHTFREIWSGMSVYLIKPDPAKSTNEWIAGAKPVMINGWRWLKKETPPADYSKNREQFAAPIEHWVLQIPDTPYWFAMRLIGSTGGDGTSWGINRNPAKYEEVKTIFHQMVESVRLTPLQ